MLKKKTLLAALAVALAIGVLPAVATADTEIELPESHSFTVTGGATSLETKTRKVSCESVTGSGEFENSTTGTVQLSYKGCKESVLATKCTTSGQSSGTIATETLPFHLKEVTEGKAAILVTPNLANGQFMAFSCVGGLVKIVVKGNGVIGLITAPEYEKESSTVTIDFSGEGGAQTHTTLDGGEKFGLEWSTNGGSLEPADLNSEVKMAFNEKITLLLTRRLHIEISLSGTGSVTGPGGLNCTNSCNKNYKKGMAVTLQANNGTKMFAGWETLSGAAGTCTGMTNPCSVTMNDDVSLKAKFQ